ncbi:MAG: SufD family Fe-S cluster assembly protein, partial [Atopobium sp.]|nr:SufD family Fe-S cluster assembly protein [Atopobium sp.]
PEEISHRVAVERCEAELGAEIAHDYDEAAANDNSSSEANPNKGGVA